MVNQANTDPLTFSGICAQRVRFQAGLSSKRGKVVVVLLVDERVRTVGLPVWIWSRELEDSAHRDGFFGASD